MNNKNLRRSNANRKGYKSKLDLYFSAFNRAGDMVEITAKPDGNGYIWSYQGPDYGDYDKMMITLPFEEAYNLFLREMGLTQGDFWGPEIYTHTANRRANRKRAEYDPTDVFYNEGVWEVANEVWDSRLLDYDVTDEMIEEKIREYSEFFLGQQADQTFVDMVMEILNANRSRTSHRANRKVASMEDYFSFFVHNLTVPSDVDDPVDYLEDFLGQYFTDVWVNDYGHDFGAEVGDGNKSMEFFIRDTGHNVNDIVYLNEDGDYRPLSEIHTARRASRKVAQEYNGWFNWDTWAAYGSITADYDDYQKGIAATRSGDPLDLIAVFENSIYREPDVDVSEVDWDEVYFALEEDN